MLHKKKLLPYNRAEAYYLHIYASEYSYNKNFLKQLSTFRNWV